jgi:sugar/nucleoside kinase (ribokinase family)
LGVAAVAILGDLNWDLVFRVPRLPKRGWEILSGDASLRLGGSATNTARFLAQLGVETRLFAALGADFLGERAQYELQKHGVPTAFLQVVPKGTGICCALVEENGERTLLTHRGANSLLGPELPPGWLEGADWLHISGYALLEPSSRTAVFSAVEEARARKIPVSLDPGMIFVHQPGLDFEELFPVDVFLPNLEEAQAMVGRKDEEGLLRELSSFGRRVFLKLGAEGALAMEGEKVIRIPAVPVEVKDTLGAGDAFNAGVIFGSLFRASLGAQAILGVVLGALSAAGLPPHRALALKLVEGIPLAEKEEALAIIRDHWRDHVD